MINKAGKSSDNQNGGQTSVRYLELETERPPVPPTQLSKHLISKSGGLSYCALGAAAVRIRFSSVILNLEERWAEFAQLFTFYWDLTRNKFSFPLSFFVTRSPLFIWTLGWRHLGIWKKSIRRSTGVPVKLGGTEWRPSMDRRPPGVEASAISPTFE